MFLLDFRKFENWGHVVALLIFIGLIYSVKAASIFNLLEDAKFKKSCENICVSPICRREAIYYMSIMNNDIDPCDDFYQFVCGNFINSGDITDQASVLNPFSLAQTRVANEIFKEVISPIRANDLESFKKTKIYYKNCMNKAHVEREGVKPLVNILEKIGGWPVLVGNNWNETNYDWKNVIYKIIEQDFFVAFPITISIDIDFKNSSNHMIKIQNAITTVSPIFMLNDTNNNLLNAYYDYMLNVTVTLGADREIALQDMKRVLDFEIQLFKIQTLPEDLMNKTEADNQITIKELSLKHPTIPWLTLLNKLFDQSGVNLNDTEIVYIFDPSYIDKLENLLKDTPKRVLANYLAFFLSHITLMYLPEKQREAILKFNQQIEGTKKILNRESWCLNEVMEAFSVSISAMFVKKYFNDEINDSVSELVENIKQQSKKNLMEVDWMDEKTRKAALEKLETMNATIGYPNELTDDRKVDDYYSELVITPGNYLKSAFNVSSFLIKQNYKSLRSPVNKFLWTLSQNSAIVNAYYIPQKNIIDIPAGFLHSFFRPELPLNYINYATTGSIIGHEMTHAFDTQGRKHDKDGNQKNWWQASTEANFFRKARCFIDQYNNFTVNEIGLKVNGVRTQSENIADNAGFKSSYNAYNEWTRKNNISEPCLPFFPYTQKQLFWISAASNWCSKQRPEYLRDILASDSHSPESARIILSFSNIKEFSNDFNCKVGSRMNPRDKCVVW